VKGRTSGEARLQAFVAHVQAEGEAAQLRAVQKAKEQQEITNGVVEAWNRSVPDLTSYLDKRVRDAYAAGRRVPSATPSAPRAHVPTPESIPDTALRDQIHTLEIEIAELEKRSALDAAQLRALQDWIRKQGM
jgi:hypothetical protein